jgi:hypothetical protein
MVPRGKGVNERKATERKSRLEQGEHKKERKKESGSQWEKKERRE